MNNRTTHSALREHFAAHLELFSWQSEWPLSERLKPAAVLIAVLPREHGLQILLTRRTDHLHHHAGQISFPGGHHEPTDPSPAATALREAQEEIGLDPHQVELLGNLPDFATPSGFRITPVVGLAQGPLSLQADPFEVAEVFEIPLDFVANPLNFQCHRIGWYGKERYVYAIPYAGRFVWGATAGILRMLARFLIEAE